jgi:hypothetical protein
MYSQPQPPTFSYFNKSKLGANDYVPSYVISLSKTAYLRQRSTNLTKHANSPRSANLFKAEALELRKLFFPKSAISYNLYTIGKLQL